VESISGQIPAAETERMMKIQEVILKAMAGKLKWWEAAEIIGVTDRTIRRWREQYDERGYSGLWDRRKRSPSPKRVSVKELEQVLQLYREKYFDFNVRHFHEKLREAHGIGFSYTWVKTALQEAGLVAKRKKPGSHRKRRPRRPLPGMLLHIDGSEHRWFSDDRKYELIVILDDATSEIYYAQLVESEDTCTVMAALREVIQTRGVFCALYSDRASHFFLDPQGKPEGRSESSDTSGAGPAEPRCEDDSGVLATSPRTHGAQLRHLAGAPAPGTAHPRHNAGRACQPVSPSGIHSGVQSPFRDTGRSERDGLCAHPSQGSGVDL
jgi:transposase